MKKIYPKKWLELHPYKQTNSVDQYYVGIANEIHKRLYSSTIADAFEEEENTPRSRVNREPREEDPGLEMISRRPPKQKFANFEEYMAAHGGATAPIAGEGPLPELVPEFHLLSVPAENLVPAEDDE